MYILYKRYILGMGVFSCIYVCAIFACSADGGQGRMLDALELELQIVSCLLLCGS